jgi:flagellar protein FlaF
VSARDTELAAFASVQRGLEEFTTERDRLVALGRNHELWSILIKALAGDANKLPAALKSQLIDIAAWSMRYSTLAILHDLPVAPLIDVNRNIAEGLAAQTVNTPVAAPEALVAAISA